MLKPRLKKPKPTNEGARCILKSDFKDRIIKSSSCYENWNTRMMTILEKSSCMISFYLLPLISSFELWTKVIMMGIIKMNAIY